MVMSFIFTHSSNNIFSPKTVQLYYRYLPSNHSSQILSFPSSKTAEMLDSPQTPRLNLILPSLPPPHPLQAAMEDEMKTVETHIQEASKIIDGLYLLKEAGDASFDSVMEGKLQYWMKEKEALRKEKEYLREKELLLLKKSIIESESKLIYSFRYKILSGTD